MFALNNFGTGPPGVKTFKIPSGPGWLTFISGYCIATTFNDIFFCKYHTTVSCWPHTSVYVNSSLLRSGIEYTPEYSCIDFDIFRPS